MRLSSVWDKAGADYRSRELGSAPSRFLGEHGRVAGLFRRTILQAGNRASLSYFQTMLQRVKTWPRDGRVSIAEPENSQVGMLI